MENREIERKFLVKDDSFRALASTRYDIVQGYVCREPGKTVRIRLCTNADGTQQAWLTIKSRLSQMVRFEWEREISIEDFKALLSTCGNRIIDKTRYILPAEAANKKADSEEPAKLKWEIDEFRQPNAGLIMAEIELPSVDTEFVRPPFIGEEVTHDPRYYNANMVC